MSLTTLLARMRTKLQTGFEDGEIRNPPTFLSALETVEDKAYDCLVDALRPTPDGRSAILDRLLATGGRTIAPLLSELDTAWSNETIAREEAAFQVGLAAGAAAAKSRRAAN